MTPEQQAGAEIAQRVTSAAVKRLAALLRSRPESEGLAEDEIEMIAIANVTGMSCMFAAVQPLLPAPETREAIVARIESHYDAAIAIWVRQAAS